MFFKDSLNIKDGVFHLPGGVYIIENERMTIFAYKGRTPEEDTPLYLALFFNVTRGSVPGQLHIGKTGKYGLPRASGILGRNASGSANSRTWGGSENPTRGNLV